MIMNQKLVVIGDGLLQGLPALVVDVHSLECDDDKHQQHDHDHHEDYLLQHLVECHPVPLLASCQENLLLLHRASLHMIFNLITFILPPLNRTVSKALMKSRAANVVCFAQFKVLLR